MNATDTGALLAPTVQNLGIGLLYGAALLVLGWWLLRKGWIAPAIKSYFLTALGLKVVASLGVAAAHYFLYEGINDPENYYLVAGRLFYYTLGEPGAACELWRAHWFDGLASSTVPSELFPEYFFTKPRPFSMVRVCTLLYPISAGNYYSLSVLMGAVAFSGMWKLTELAAAFIPRYAIAAVALLCFLPSNVFWSSGLLKEAVVLAGLGWGLYGAYQIWQRISQKKWQALQLMGWAGVVLISGFLLAAIKPFVLVALLAVVFVCLLAYPVGFSGRRRRPYWLVFKGSAAVVLVWLLWASPYNLRRVFDEVFYLRGVEMEKVPDKSVDDTGFFRLHPEPTTGLQAALVAPEATFTALYRPMPWEVQNWQAVIFALERLALLVGSIWFVLRQRLWKGMGRRLRGSPLAVGCLGFGLGYAYFLGITEPFWGTLTRYMVVAWPAWGVGLLALAAANERPTGTDAPDVVR